MPNVFTGVTSVTDITREPESKRFGLDLHPDDFRQLGEDLDRIGDAERSAEIAAAVLRIF